MEAQQALTQAAHKVFFIGEFGWTNDAVPAFLDAVLASSACGALFWSLFPHADTFGFVDHGDGFTLHWPGKQLLLLHPPPTPFDFPGQNVMGCFWAYSVELTGIAAARGHWGHGGQCHHAAYVCVQDARR